MFERPGKAYLPSLARDVGTMEHISGRQDSISWTRKDNSLILSLSPCTPIKRTRMHRRTLRKTVSLSSDDETGRYFAQVDESSVEGISFT